MARELEYKGPGAAALQADEAHPFIRERLAALLFDWRYATDFGRAVDIVLYWLALGRITEARALADELADGIPREAVSEFWAQIVICLAARLARQANDSARHEQLITRMTTPEFVGSFEYVSVEEHLSNARAVFERQRVPGPIDEACNELTETLSMVVCFAELGAERIRWQQGLALDGVEALMTAGLHLLGDHLAGRIALPERLDIAPIPEHTGVLIIKTQAIPADRFALWWIDLATGDSGRVRGARARGEIIPIRDSSAAWVLTARDDDREGAGLLDRASLSIEFVADLAVCAISPDGCHAVIIDPEDGSLVMATIDGTTITRRDNLGVTGDPWNLAVLAVLADGSAVIKTTDGDTALVQVFRVGAAPSFVLRVEAEAEVYVANDASIVVTIPWDRDDNRELTIYRPSAGEAPRTVSLGRGGTTACFAPGNQYFVVSVWADNGAGRVIAIDLANAKPVEIAADVASPFTVSPDGRFVVVWNQTLMIVPIGGGTVRSTIIEGDPLAWLR